MKKINFLFTTLIFLLFAIGYSNAQNKTVETDLWDWEGIMICTDDYAVGVESMVATYWNSKMQVRYKGKYEGVSGKYYTWSMVINDNWKSLKEGQAANRTYVSTSVIECEGVPIAIYKIRFHVTLNANGDLVVQRYWDSGDDWVCL